MAITAESHNADVIGRHRMDCGSVTTGDVTAITLGVGLSIVKSIQLCPSPAAAPTIVGGAITFTPAAAGVTYFTAIGE